jgi:predicted nuclease of predicted toxin-antitoxin system
VQQSSRCCRPDLGCQVEVRRRSSKRGASDEDVIQLAISERRILLTEDKDFGQLVYAAARSTGGVVFIRFPATARTGLAATVVELFAGHGPELVRSFAVVQPGRVRISRA